MPVARPTRHRLGCLAFGLAIFLAAPPASNAQSSTTEPPRLSAKAATSQILRPGDLVRIRIWREPDLSGDYPVDESGMVVFPLIGPRRVSDMRPDSLKQQLIEEYGVYLQNPSIDVILLRRINVLGAVQQPGLYPVDATMTIADALALAGGATPLGDPEKVDLIRAGETVEASLSRRARMGELGIRSGDQLYVPERSWLARNSNIVAAALTASISLIIALVR